VATPGVLIALLVGQVWITGTTVNSGLPSLTVTASGRECASAVGTAALISFVVAGAVLLMGPVGRRFASGAGVVVTVIATLATIRVLRDPLTALSQAGTTATTLTTVAGATARPVVWIVLILLAGLTAVMLVIAVGRAPNSAASEAVTQTESPSGTSRPLGDGDRSATNGVSIGGGDSDGQRGASFDDSRHMWDALDQGVDPTAER
jgi:uncharacterized membrane protein YgcG